MAVYYTISHRDTGEPLGFGGPLDRAKAVAIIQSRTKGDDGRPFAASEWMVTSWIGDGSDDDKIAYQVSADEFSACNGRV